MGFEAPWNEDGFGEPSPAESPLLRAKSKPGEAIEAYDEDSGGAYASLSSLGAPKKKKKMVLTVDPEELEKAHNAIHMGAAQQMEIEELPGGELPPRMPAPMLGLSAMGAEDEDAEEGEWALGEEMEDEDAALPPLPDFSSFSDEEDEFDAAAEEEPIARATTPVARSLDHLLRPGVAGSREDDDEVFIPSIEQQLRNMRKRPRALPDDEVEQAPGPTEPPLGEEPVAVEPPLPEPEPSAEVGESEIDSWDDEEPTTFDAQDDHFAAGLPPLDEAVLAESQPEEPEAMSEAVVDDGAEPVVDDDDVTIPWVMLDELPLPPAKPTAAADPEPDPEAAAEPGLEVESAEDVPSFVEESPAQVATVDAPATEPVEQNLPDTATEAPGEPVPVELDLGDAAGGEVYAPVTFDGEPVLAPKPMLDDCAFEPESEAEWIEEPVAAALPEREDAKDDEQATAILDLAGDGLSAEFAEEGPEPALQIREGEHSQLRARLIGSAERSMPRDDSPSLLTMLWRWLVGLFGR